jgi:nicotinate phosphoribosyltransferase
MNTLQIPYFGLYADYYQFTMAQGYFLHNRFNDIAVFEYFFRSNPFNGGYTVAAGISDLIDWIQAFRFDEEALCYLECQGFQKAFLDYLKTFRFTGTIWGVRDGEIVFPYEPILCVEAPIIEAQILETCILNWLNFHFLIATKARRIVEAARGKMVIDFGLRRAQGLSGLHYTKAAFVGGILSTSNVWCAFTEGISAAGTMAHAWIQSFPSEYEAFRAYAQLYPTKTVLLLDTYDTLHSGLPNAIRVAKELEAQGYRLLGVRLDSGDIAYLSKAIRKRLDGEGLSYVKIVASNELDEYVIQSLELQGTKVDIYGVGTRLAVADGTPALGGVYKLAAINHSPRMKRSDNLFKMTLPGKKFLYRYFSDDDTFYADQIVTYEEREKPSPELFHPHYPDLKKVSIRYFQKEPLWVQWMRNGVRTYHLPLQEAQAYAQKRYSLLEASYRRLENPHEYKVGISNSLLSLTKRLLAE